MASKHHRSIGADEAFACSRQVGPGHWIVGSKPAGAVGRELGVRCSRRRWSRLGLRLVGDRADEGCSQGQCQDPGSDGVAAAPPIVSWAVIVRKFGILRPVPALVGGVSIPTIAAVSIGSGISGLCCGLREGDAERQQGEKQGRDLAHRSCFLFRRWRAMDGAAQ